MRLLDHIINKRNGHYCHCIEVGDTYDMESIAESVIQEYSEDFTEAEIIEFLDSLDVYCTDEVNEDSVYSFSFKEYIEGTL